jgi:glycosyltransferase involved in cell wall biosynthesis
MALSAETKISVLIPSLADTARAALLDRAIASVLKQEGVDATPTVVVNGARRDPNVIAWLKRQSAVGLVELPFNCGLPEARLAGRDAVDAPFFATLDDDDVFLPHALATRLQPMLADDGVDVVITNGYRDTAGVQELTDPHIERFQSDPLEGLMESNWLNGDGGLFRTSSIGREFFVDLPVIEWTHVAFKLAQSRKIRFINTPTFINYRQPNSSSQSKRYSLERPHALREMLRWRMPPSIRRQLRQKYVMALHDTSADMLERQDFVAAWGYHLESIAQPGGVRYLGYTRHIILRHLRNLLGR